MGSVNYPNPSTDQTVRIFDQFYAYEAVVPAQEYDAVYSYFRSVFTDDVAAGNFTVTVFRVSNLSGIPIMDILQQLQSQPKPQITLTLAYYLNNLRDNSTLLGVNSATTPNYYVARNVRA
jgi:hypothetical protein